MPITAEDEDEITRIQLHSSAGGRHAALEEVVDFLRSRAGSAFAAGKDSEAVVVRSLANEIEVRRKAASEDLQRHINERTARK